MIKLKEVTAVWYGKFEISCLTSITSILVVIWWNKSIIWACNPGKKTVPCKESLREKVSQVSRNGRTLRDDL